MTQANDDFDYSEIEKEVRLIDQQLMQKVE